MKPLIILMLIALTMFEAEGKKTQASCQVKADVVFIVDSSRSIWRPDYVKELQFLANITQELNVSPDGTHVGAISFSEGARVDFYLNSYMKAKQLKKKIQAIPFMQGGKTETYEGLRLAREELFTARHGARRDVPQIIIIVTDGNSFNRDATKEQAGFLRNLGIEVFAVGIGNSVDRNQLAELATKDTDTYVHTVSSYSSLGLDILMPDFIPAACKMKTTAAPEVKTSPATPSETGTSTDSMIKDEEKRVCTSKKADVVFVLDKSSSITHSHFKKQLNFVSDVIDIFNVRREHTHISVVTFDYNATVEFDLRDYYHKSEIRRAIAKIKYTAGATNTYLALEKVAEEVLSIKGGYRKDVAHVVIVVTDGKSSKEKETKAWANKLKARGVYMFAIGVGTEVDQKELVNIGSKPASNFVFEVLEGYNALNTIKDILATRACEVPSGDLFVRCKQDAVPSDVMFITHFSHEGEGDITRTADLIKSAAAGIMTSEKKVRVGLVSSPCPGLADVQLGQAPNATAFATAVTTGDTGGLKGLLSRARVQLTKRKDVQRVAVLFLHGPVKDYKAATSEIMRAKSNANKPGVKFIFVGMGSRVNETQMRLMSDRRKPEEANVIMEMEQLKKGGQFWQSVLTKVCEELSPRTWRK